MGRTYYLFIISKLFIELYMMQGNRFGMQWNTEQFHSFSLATIYSYGRNIHSSKSHQHYKIFMFMLSYMKGIKKSFIAGEPNRNWKWGGRGESSPPLLPSPTRTGTEAFNLKYNQLCHIGQWGVKFDSRQRKYQVWNTWERARLKKDEQQWEQQKSGYAWPCGPGNVG